MVGARATARITARHLEGRLLAHELAAIRLRRRLGPLLMLALSGAVPVVLWAPGVAGPSECGTHGGAGPHVAWFRCTIAQVESQNMSDFPTLHYLATISERYQQAIEHNDSPAIQATEDELSRSSGEPTGPVRPGGRRTGCPTSVIAFCD